MSEPVNPYSAPPPGDQPPPFGDAPASATTPSKSGCGPVVLGAFVVWGIIIGLMILGAMIDDATRSYGVAMLLLPLVGTLAVMTLAFAKGRTGFAGGMIAGFIGGIALMFLAFVTLCGNMNFH